MRVSRHATRLSGMLWEAYEARRFDADAATETITHYLTTPVDDGTLIDLAGELTPLALQAAVLGRAIRRIGRPNLADLMLDEAQIEIEAVRRAELEDFSGRAEQALRMNRPDASPAQVWAAHQILHGVAMQQAHLTDLLRLEPAAACTALLVWCHAATQVYAEITATTPVTAARAASQRDRRIDHGVLCELITRLEAGTDPAQIVAELAQLTRLTELHAGLVTAYQVLCRLIDTTAGRIPRDGTPRYGQQPLPPPGSRTWAELRASDPDEHDVMARQAETRLRIAQRVAESTSLANR